MEKQNWIGKDWRVAVADEIAALQALEGAPHVTFGCTECGMVNWSAKNLALSGDGCYNGMRNICNLGDHFECDCASNLLRCVVRL